jgi:hypothetical protein
MKGLVSYRVAGALLLVLAITGCASGPVSDPNARQTVRRKPVPNLDRQYDWGSTPGVKGESIHVSD